VVCVVTGHGLKDPEIVLNSEAAPLTLPASIEALAGHLGLR
jgi:threonine synthase